MSEKVTKRKRLAIIDGKSVFYRGYYAMPNLATKEGAPTGGVFGFATMALEVIRKLQPDYVCVAWDKPKTNIRKRVQMYPEYKAGRKPAPPDFYEQIPLLQELLKDFGWPLYELDDYEADDIMGTLAVQATAQDIETMLVTSDLDMLQLVDLHVSVYALKKGLSNIELFHPESFTEKYGLLPVQFLDLKALKGDSSDNIPGVPGIGEKTAIELLKQYHTLDGIYENLALTKDSVRKKLEAGKDLAYLSKQLAAIWTDAPLKLDLKKMDGSLCHPEKVQELLQRLEFRSLVRQLPEVMQVADAAPAHVPAGLKLGKVTRVDTDAALAKLELGVGSTAAPAVVYSRSRGKHGREPQLLILSPKPDVIYELDLTKLDRTKTAATLQKLGSLVGYDVKATLKVLLELGLTELPAVEHDILVGAFLINSLQRVQSLSELADRGLGYTASSLDDLDTEELRARAPELIAVIRGLYEQQIKELKKYPKLPTLAKDIEWPVIPVLARMEYEGIELDTDYLKHFQVEIDDAISDLEQQIYGYADAEFNIGSPGQLADVLFTTLKLPTNGIKKGKTGYSTAASELDKLRAIHPIIDLITQYREVTKLKNTYVDTLPRQVDEHSRIHTTFNLTVAQTGRLSSTDPNLQNIPIRTDLGKRIRTAFVAGKGKVLVGADYSQFELRLAAVLSGDKTMINAFKDDDTDIHTQTAALVHGIKPAEVTKNMRRDAKVVNFGVMYGLSPHGLSVATGLTREQAADFIKRYFEIRTGLLAYIESVKEKAKEDGYVETMFGRRRPTPDVRSSNFAVREAAMRAAVNMPFQGTAADIMKLAMIAVQNILPPEANILLQIHDSILVECPKADGERVAKLLKTTMEGVCQLAVNLKVDTDSGKNWGEL